MNFMFYFTCYYLYEIKNYLCFSNTECKNTVNIINTVMVRFQPSLNTVLQQHGSLSTFT